MSDTISEAFATVAELASVLGVRSIKDLPGLWELQVDGTWKVRVNGHKETIEHVPPYHMAIEYNGFPAGIVGPKSGVIAAGALANEDAFIAALKARIEKERVST